MVRTHKLCNAQNTQSFHATTLTPDNFYFLNKFCTVHDNDTICTRFESAKGKRQNPIGFGSLSKKRRSESYRIRIQILKKSRIRADWYPNPEKKVRIRPDSDQLCEKQGLTYYIQNVEADMI